MAPTNDVRSVLGDELTDLVSKLANDPAADAAARQAQRDQSDLAASARRAEMAAQVTAVLRGSLGRHKEATECIKSLQGLLGTVAPREAEPAILITCVSMIGGAKKRIRDSRRGRRAAGGSR